MRCGKSMLLRRTRPALPRSLNTMREEQLVSAVESSKQSDSDQFLMDILDQNIVLLRTRYHH